MEISVSPVPLSLFPFHPIETQGRVLACGHYIADIRNGPADISGPTWLRYNDETVSVASSKSVYSDFSEQDAYLLVYVSRAPAAEAAEKAGAVAAQGRSGGGRNGGGGGGGAGGMGSGGMKGGSGATATGARGNDAIVID